MWNASYVQKTLQLTCQEKLDDPPWNSVRSMLSTSLFWGKFRSDWTNRKNNSRLRQQCSKLKVLNGRRAGSGLAGRQIGRWKNAGTFSRPTSKVFVGSGLEVGPRAPALKWNWRISKTNKHLISAKSTSSGRRLYIFPDGPHTRLAAARLFFGNCGMVREALSGPWSRIQRLTQIKKQDKSAFELARWPRTTSVVGRRP